MLTRKLAYGMILGLAAAVQAGTPPGEAVDRPALTAARRDQLEQEAKRIEAELEAAMKAPARPTARPRSGVASRVPMLGGATAARPPARPSSPTSPQARLGGALKQPSRFSGPLKSYAPLGVIDASIRLGVIRALLGDRTEPRGSFLRAWGWERELIKKLVSSQPGGEEAFSPSLLEKRWPARDACLSITDTAYGFDGELYKFVSVTKGYSTRVLERGYEEMRRYSLGGSQDSKARMDVRRQIVRLLLEPTPDLDERDRRLEELLRSKTQLMNRQIDPNAISQAPEEVKLVHNLHFAPNEIRNQLGGSRAFVDFLRYSRMELEPAKGEARYTPNYVAFVLSSRIRGVSDGRRIDLGPCKPIDDAVTRWRAAIEGGVDDAKEAESVDRLVWQPIAKALPDGLAAIYLSPDGQLSNLPWAALPGRGPGHTYLLEDYALAQVPSARFLLLELLRSRTQAEYEAFRERVRMTPPSFRGVGQINLSDQVALSVKPRPAVEGYAPIVAVGGVHDDLPASIREIAHLKEFAGEHPVVALTGTEATPTRLIAELPRACSAHLATHGFFAEAALLLYEQRRAGNDPSSSLAGLGSVYPLAYTGLELAGPAPNSDYADRVLTSETIPEFDLSRMRLCVLSACQTGLGGVTSGEGVQGLVRAFHLAGCPNVVASLWNIKDDATEALMKEFYRQLLQENKPPIEALRQAQLGLYRHPEWVTGSPSERKAPVSPDVTRPVNPAPASTTAANPAAIARRSPPKWWAAFVLSGAGSTSGLLTGAKAKGAATTRLRPDMQASPPSTERGSKTGVSVSGDGQ